MSLTQYLSREYNGLLTRSDTFDYMMTNYNTGGSTSTGQGLGAGDVVILPLTPWMWKNNTKLTMQPGRLL